MMTKYLNILRVAILCWKQERILKKCVRECGFRMFTDRINKPCKHSKLHTDYEVKISKITTNW